MPASGQPAYLSPQPPLSPLPPLFMATTLSLPQSNLLFPPSPPFSPTPSQLQPYYFPTPTLLLPNRNKSNIKCNLSIHNYHCPTSSKSITKTHTNRLFRSTPKPPQQDDLDSPLPISSNMWLSDLRSAFGQRFSLEGIISSVKVVTDQPQLALPHAAVPDIRWIDWSELHKRGFRGVVFDKDNTITAPYLLTLWAPLSPSIERCKAVFGEDNVAVFSNSAGLSEFDPDGSKARVLESRIGIKVIRHRVKKPAGNAEEIEKHFGCPSSTLVMVGDRHFTDIVYGNRNGFLTILTKPLSVIDEPFVVRQVRKIEGCLASRWRKKGLKAADHVSGLVEPQEVVCMKDPVASSPL